MQRDVLEEFLICTSQKDRETFLLKYHAGYTAARHAPQGAPLHLFAFGAWGYGEKGDVICSHREAVKRLKELKGGKEVRVVGETNSPQIPLIEKGLQDSQCFREAQKYIKGFLKLFEKKAYPTLARRLNREFSPHVSHELEAKGFYFIEVKRMGVDVFGEEDIILECLRLIWKKLPHAIAKVPIWESGEDFLRERRRLLKMTPALKPVGWRFPKTGARDPFKKQRALSLVAEGLSIRKAAESVGVNASTVSRWKKQEGQGHYSSDERTIRQKSK